MAKNGLVLICIVLEGCGAAVFNCADDDACEGELFSAEMSLLSLLFDEGALRIGADFDYGLGSNFMLGAIDDVRIYSRVLDADEVLALYQLGDP